MDSSTEDLAVAVYRDVFDTRITNYVAFIGYLILVWDHIITFEDEVRYVWQGRKTFVIYLFFFNRYFTPFAFIGNLVAYFSDWSFEYCQDFVRYQGAMTAIAVWVSGLMMLMRVKALYTDRPRVIQALFALLLAEAGVFIWLLTHGVAVQHTPAVTACTMIFNPNLKFFPSLSAWFPLVFDTIVIILTLYRCAGPVRQHTASHILFTLMRDGLLYYSVIFGVNLVLAIMIVFARDGIKNITAQLEQLLTVAMMSRITLSLRRKALKDPSSEEDSYLFPRNTPLESFRAFDADEVARSRRRTHHDWDWDKWSEDWIEHADQDRHRFTSRDSSPWRSHRDGFYFSGGSIDSDPNLRSRTPSRFSRPTGIREEVPLRNWRSSGSENDGGGQGASVNDIEELEHGIPKEPEQVFLTDRGERGPVNELRASPFIR